MTITTNPQVEGWNPSRTTLPPTDVTPDALVLNTKVATIVRSPDGDATYIRAPFVPDDPTADIVREGEEIPVGETGRAEIRIYTRKIGIIQRVSREAYEQQMAGDNGSSNASDLFTNSLKRAVTSKVDGLFLNAPENKQDVYAPGLATDTTPAIIDGANITDNLDPLIDAIATIADNGATPACILTSNSGWARLQRMKYSDGRPVVNPDVQAEALPQLAGLPVIRNGAVPANKLFVIDPSNIIVAYSDLSIDVDRSTYFTADSYAIRVMARLGWGIAYRGRIARLTIGQDDTGKTTKKTIDLHVGA